MIEPSSVERAEQEVLDVVGRVIAPIHLRLGEIRVVLPAMTLLRIGERVKRLPVRASGAGQVKALAGVGRMLSSGVAGAVVGAGIRLVVNVLYGMFQGYVDYPAPDLPTSGDPLEAAMAYLASFGLALLASREWELVYLVNDADTEEGGEIVITDVTPAASLADSGAQAGDGETADDATA
jgi:hypothetical protein